MSNVNITPNMNLPNPVPGVDPGPDYASNLQSALNIVDQHNHTAGNGVQIVPAAININTDLPFNGNNATAIKTIRFLSQSAPITNSAPNVGILYISGNELWYNDYTGGNQVQITTNGGINATSSGISNGTASATFSAGTLLVKSSSTSYANIDLQSLVLSNAGNLTNQLTLLAPTLSSSYNLTLPSVPVANSFLQIDTSGNISAGPTISLGITAANIANQTITATQIANQTITATQIANSTITGTQVVTNVNLAGKAVQESGHNVAVSNTNATNSLAIVRGGCNGAGSPTLGEGFTVSKGGSGNYTITFSTAFADSPAVSVTPFSGTDNTFATLNSLSNTGFNVVLYSITSGLINTDLVFIAIGQRA